MIIFGAIFFILLFETLIFVYFFPLIENITNTKLPMPIKIGFLLIQFIVLLWIYSQIILIFRGDLEQVRQNVTDVKKLIPIIDFEKYNFDQFIKNLDLSFRYNHILLIFGMIIYPMIAILVLSKIFRSLKITYLKNIIILLFIVYLVYSLPFHIVDSHNDYLAEKQQESIRLENEQKENVRINSNSELLHIYRGYEGIRKLICLDYYYRENDGCKKQEEKCKNIKYMFKDSVKPEDVELLENMKAGCSYNGWF